MADAILRKKVRGRRVDGEMNWKGWKSGSNLASKFKARSIDDAYFPKGYKFNNVARIKQDHMNDNKLQDDIQGMKEYRIRHEPPGPRKDYLIKEYNYWIQNGRPVAAGQNSDKNRVVKRRLKRAWQSGKPMFTDYVDDNERMIKEIINK